MRSADQKRMGDLVAWAASHGATVHPSVEIYHDEVTKFSLRVKPHSPAIEADSTVVTCPFSITLSYLNAIVNGPLTSSVLTHHLSSSDSQSAFPTAFITTLSPHVIGRFYLIQQYLRGPTSPWHAYIATLPQPERLHAWALPAFWPDDDLALLSGTNLDGAAETIREHARREFKAARRVLKECAFEGWQDYSRALYNWALCMFTSRSFRTRLVVPDALRADINALLGKVEVEGEASVSLEDFSVLMPVFDVANHNLTARVVWDTTESGAARDSCAMKLGQRYEPGTQVFNNYGLKTNSELLLGYGFVVPETENIHNDYVHLQRKALPDETPSVDVGPAGQGFPAESGSEQKASRFLVSLRPMDDPSSIVGCSKMRGLVELSVKPSPPLAHVEAGLVLDLALAQMSHDESTALESLSQLQGAESVQDVKAQQNNSPQNVQTSHQDRMLRALFKEPLDPRLASLTERTKELLIAKLEFDLDRIKELEEDGELEPVTVAQAGPRNQLLAWQYRKQCEKVLQNAISALQGSLGAV